MGQETYQLSVRYKDFEYAVSGDRAFVDEHDKVVQSYLSKMMKEDLKTTPGRRGKISNTFEIDKSTPEAPKPLPQSNTGEKPDIQKFLEKLPLNSEWQFTLAMAYYLSHFKQQSSFTAKMVRKQFREARHTVPNNIHLSVHTCVKKGYLQESGQQDLQKIYEMTESGYAYIDTLLSSTSYEKSNVEGEADKLDFEAFNFENNPDPRILERIEDQALSILYIYMKEFDRAHMSAKEVYDVLKNYFSTDYSSKAIQIALSRSRPLVEKIKFEGQMHYQLTAKGIDHMETLLGNQV
ncbi:hypothetical protein JMA_29790 [Jeotgalibacillus malaysiensis]|uniref:Uncharacterized protein n=1 Tax=Jeotgalibacillus malaysiensis TaxID=1508404 RepID=A0A0B5AQC0_9BACL|nr:hypothetical protein [Jeotgalibacillus malaysiensis]AJD92296.1 hypothetical protein JMA_29790 [Jeotgalibacillus malaysiensis]